jgi:predicted membrane channel-forming protein YqfA (hemolysin III family)
MKMNVPTPSRLTWYVALACIVTAAVAVVYRKLEGDDLVASVIGGLAVFLGLVFLVLRSAERRRHYNAAVSRSSEIGNWNRWARRAAGVGAILAVGSFAWLLFAIEFLNPQLHALFFDIWMVFFLIGAVLLFSPAYVRLASVLNIIGRDGSE